MRYPLFHLTVALAFTITVFGSVQGQGSKLPAKPDLGGTWAFDLSRSNVGSASAANSEIRISHHDPELKISMTVTVRGNAVTRELTYYTDGRGETNPATMWISSTPDPNAAHQAETKSKTRWSGDRVVIRSTLRVMADVHPYDVDVVDEWKVSSDGKTLTHTTRRLLPPNTREQIFVPANRPDDKRVYALVSK